MTLKNKRGVVVEYAIIVMMLVLAFTLTIVVTSRASITQASEYNSYVVEKTELDEIGSICIDYYVSGAGDPAEVTAKAEEYGYTMTNFDRDGYLPNVGATGSVTVSKSGKVCLTMQFTSDGSAFELTAYVYGEI